MLSIVIDITMFDAKHITITNFYNIHIYVYKHIIIYTGYSKNTINQKKTLWHIYYQDYDFPMQPVAE